MSVPLTHLLYSFSRLYDNDAGSFLVFNESSQLKRALHLAKILNLPHLEDRIKSTQFMFSKRCNATYALHSGMSMTDASLKEGLLSIGYEENPHLDEIGQFTHRGKNIIISTSIHERYIISLIKGQVQSISSHSLSNDSFCNIPDCSLPVLTKTAEAHQSPQISQLEPTTLVTPSPIPLLLKKMHRSDDTIMSPEEWYTFSHRLRDTLTSTTHYALIKEHPLPPVTPTQRDFLCHSDTVPLSTPKSQDYTTFFKSESHSQKVWVQDTLQQEFSWQNTTFSPHGQQAQSSQTLAFEKAFSFAVDDYVIHMQYGVGRFKGIRFIKADGKNIDCLAVEYADNTVIYVPALEAHNLHFYADKDQELSLQDTTGKSWLLSKRKTTEEMRKFAENMIKTAATRSITSAASIIPDSKTLELFVESFPHTLTPGQQTAINEIQRDIQAVRPMNRILCADVAFGKTEVAMRAACMTASRGYQALIVTPTVLLSLQHYQNYHERFKRSGLKAILLNRLVSAKQEKVLRENIKSGQVDIVITTHAAFHKSLTLPHLGLCIIDEEHLFGVTQKEYIKQTYPDVHILSMSATPIPRTLHMALSGIQSFSVITDAPTTLTSTPPTITCQPYKASFLADFVTKQIANGQIFLVTPHIKDIAFLENVLKDVCKYTILTGQHSRSDTLEKIEEFSAGKTQVFLSTNIIGMGIDLPMVNSLIIYNAQLFGLAQLYQLKGRINRRDVSGHVLLLHPPTEQLSENAKKRLQYICDNPNRGDHIKIARLDMQMRGSGRLVGKEQAGHLFSLGASLYQTMLAQAISDARSPKEGSDPWKASVVTSCQPSIPETYIADSTERVNVYRISTRIRDLREMQIFEQECISKYGSPPQEFSQWFSLLKIQITATKLGIQELRILSFGLDVHWHPSSSFLEKNTEELLEILHNIRFQQTAEGKLRYMRSLRSTHLFADTLQALDDLNEILKLTPHPLKS